MPDPLRRVNPGDEVHFSAAAWNAFVDAAKAEQQRQFDRFTGVPSFFNNSDIVRFRNDTGTDLARFSVIGLSTTLFLPDDPGGSFFQESAFVGVTPTWEYRGRFGVLTEPVPEGGIGKCWVSGIAIALVEVIDWEHCFCDIKNNATDRLISGGEGAAQILWREGEEPYGAYDEGYGYTAGPQWAVVRIGKMSTDRWAKLPSGGINAGSNGTIEFYYDGKMSALTGQTATAYNNWSDNATPTSRKCRVKRSGTRWQVDFWGCT